MVAVLRSVVAMIVVGLRASDNRARTTCGEHGFFAEPRSQRCLCFLWTIRGGDCPTLASEAAPLALNRRLHPRVW